MKYSLIFLSALTVFLSTSVARANEMSHLMQSRRPIPDFDCNEVPKEFKNAQHPYAKKPDGCSGISSPKEVRDTWGPVKFTKACNEHDKCYYTEGSKAEDCNSEFFTNLLVACAQAKIKDRDTKAACTVLAASYAAGVELGVKAGMFKDAQKLQRSYNEWYRSCH